MLLYCLCTIALNYNKCLSMQIVETCFCSLKYTYIFYLILIELVLIAVEFRKLFSVNNTLADVLFLE